MNLLRESRGWLLPFLAHDVAPASPTVQIIEVSISGRLAVACRGRSSHSDGDGSAGPARAFCGSPAFFPLFGAHFSPQYLVYPKQKDDFCLVRLSDGDFYVTAKLTARAIALLEQHDLSATQIKGACMS